MTYLDWEREQGKNFEVIKTTRKARKDGGKK